jgi:hypothetical protein
MPGAPNEGQLTRNLVLLVRTFPSMDWYSVLGLYVYREFPSSQRHTELTALTGTREFGKP